MHICWQKNTAFKLKWIKHVRSFTICGNCSIIQRIATRGADVTIRIFFHMFWRYRSLQPTRRISNLHWSKFVVISHLPAKDPLILKWILRRQGVMLQTGFIRLRIETTGTILEPNQVALLSLPLCKFFRPPCCYYSLQGIKNQELRVASNGITITLNFIKISSKI
jgi:hypothetical protein